MLFTARALAVSLALDSAALASLATPRGLYDRDDSGNIFPNPGGYFDWAICQDIITKTRFPKLQTPGSGGGCVRYFQGIDITGVTTELHFFFKDGFTTACDCVAQCLEQPNNCTNWVWKHTFMNGQDSGRRSCTLYSDTNMPSSVTLAFDTSKCVDVQPLATSNNPQVGAGAPLTFSNKAGTQPDTFGVSGFTMQDQNGNLYC